MYSRRHFLKLTGLLGLIPLAARGQIELPEEDNDQHAKSMVFPEDRIAFVQGATDAHSTLLSILVHKKTQPNIKIMDMFFQTVPFTAVRKNFGLDEDFVVYQIFLDGLRLGEDYAIMVSDPLYSDVKIRYFRTLDLNNKNTKIALLSCTNHRNAGPKSTMFRKLFRSQPDVIFYNGDLVYGNSSLDTYLNRPAKIQDAYKIYIKTLLEFELYSQKNLIPIFAAWDDHDLAYNNSDVTHPYKDFYLDLFRSIFSADSRVKAVSQGPGSSFSIEAFGLQIFFFDTRFFKNKKKEIFLGQNQLDWMKKELAKSALPKMLVLSQQLLYYSFIAESYERNARKEFNEFISAIKNLQQPTLFVTGDVHYSQIQHVSESLVGYKTYEITSSAMFSGSAGRFGKRKESDGQIAYYGYPNFVTLEQIKTDADSIEMHINCISEYSDKQFSKTIKVDI